MFLCLLFCKLPLKQGVDLRAVPIVQSLFDRSTWLLMYHISVLIFWKASKGGTPVVSAHFRLRPQQVHKAIWQDCKRKVIVRREGHSHATYEQLTCVWIHQLLVYSEVGVELDSLAIARVNFVWKCFGPYVDEVILPNNKLWIIRPLKTCLKQEACNAATSDLKVRHIKL